MRVGHAGLAKERVGIAEIPTPLRQALPQRPGSSGALRPWRLGHRSHRHVGGLRSEGQQHEIVRRDGDRGRRAVPFVVEPVDGYAARRRREADVPDEDARLEIHAARTQPSDQRFDERLVLVERRAPDVRHVRNVWEHVQGAIQVAPQLHRAVLRQRPHDCRIAQPKFGREELRGKELLDAPPVQHRFGRQREPR